MLDLFLWNDPDTKTLEIHL